MKNTVDAHEIDKVVKPRVSERRLDGDVYGVVEGGVPDDVEAVLQAAGDVVEHRPHRDPDEDLPGAGSGADGPGSEGLDDGDAPLPRHRDRGVDCPRVADVHHGVEQDVHRLPHKHVADEDVVVLADDRQRLQEDDEQQQDVVEDCQHDEEQRRRGPHPFPWQHNDGYGVAEETKQGDAGAADPVHVVPDVHDVVQVIVVGHQVRPVVGWGLRKHVSYPWKRNHFSQYLGCLKLFVVVFLFYL